MSTQECDWNTIAGLIRGITKLPVSALDNSNMITAPWAAISMKKRIKAFRTPQS